MKKIYISPATNLVEIKLRDGILIDASQVGGDSTYTPGASGESNDWYQDGSGSGSITPTHPGGGTYGEVDYSRNGGGNVWDNAW